VHDRLQCTTRAEVGSGRPYRDQANGGVVQAIPEMVTRVEIPRGLSRIKDLRASRPTLASRRQLLEHQRPLPNSQPDPWPVLNR
jgi:hypothetical protein